MNRVLCFGEALIDFLHSGEQQEGGIHLNAFTQYPGGAPANAAVAVAKLGGKASFVGQVGQDMFGDFLVSSLEHYSVDTHYVAQHAELKTALAFVARDENGERRFSFYRDNSADLGYRQSQIDDAMYEDANVIHFCSNTLTDQKICETTEAVIKRARAAGLLVSFDVNLRHNLWPEGKADVETVNAFVEKADILKFSREEIDYLTDDIDSYVDRLLSNSAQLVVITNDGDDIFYYSTTVRGSLAVPKVNVVDTTAGGDGFSGGLLYQLSRVEEVSAICKDADKLRALVSFAAHCGGFAVTRPGAFPALPTLADVSESLPAFIGRI